MADPLDVQRAQRGANARGARGLTGVGGQPEPGVGRLPVHIGEQPGWIVGFGAADADADHPSLGGDLSHLCEGSSGPFRPGVANEVDDQRDIDSVDLIQSASDRQGQLGAAEAVAVEVGR